MKRKSGDVVWPPAEGEPLDRQIEPPAMLEERVVDALHARGLLAPERSTLETHPGWRVMRASLAAAACAGLLVAGVWLGRITGPTPAVSPLTGAETDLYALLLYETDGYERPVGAAARARYGEYSAWVATAVGRGQFVTGEDFDVDRGWLLVPTDEGSELVDATSVAADTPLSGIFFVRARDEMHALELARELPHIRHGGSVLVQKTIPTDTPPD